MKTFEEMINWLEAHFADILQQIKDIIGKFFINPLD